MSLNPKNDPDREKLIQDACEWMSPYCKDLKSAKEILTSFDYKPKSGSRLWFALDHGFFNTIPWLLSDGEDFKQEIPIGMEILHYLSAKDAQLPNYLFELFVNLGADFDAKNVMGISVFKNLCNSHLNGGRPDLFKFLLEKGANPNQVMSNDRRNLCILSHCLRQPALYEFAHLLLSAGVDVHQPDFEGSLPIVYFLENMRKQEDNLEGKESLFLHLLEKGADLDKGEYCDDYYTRNGRFIIDSRQNVDPNCAHILKVYTLYEREKMATQLPISTLKENHLKPARL